ncbi:MAG: hypothetical protein IJT80_08540 [Lachnospiraceae bacterium]|nr:hypothetical protein [Lachnospiraceae bacterium]
MSNLLKSGYVIKKEDARVIDSNELIASRLQSLSEMMEREDEPEYDDDGSDGFTEGLNAQQLEMLLEDNPQGAEGDDGLENDEGNVIHADPGAMLEDARQEAEELLENARSEAQGIIDEANSEAESIRASFKEQGYSEGYEQGHSEGLKVIDEKVRELEEKEAGLMAEYDKKLEEMEPVLVDAITDIFEHIFHVSLSSNREIMLNLLHDTVRNVEGGKNFIVHVSKDDFEYINDRKDQLTEGLGSTDTIEVIEDLTLRQSECFVEAEGGIYDCGIGTELELLKKELMLLAYQKS